MAAAAVPNITARLSIPITSAIGSPCPRFAFLSAARRIGWTMLRHDFNDAEKRYRCNGNA
jgi:hypothetical protein